MCRRLAPPADHAGHLCRILFNLANVCGAPLINGASAEYGLNSIIRFLEAEAHGGPPIAPKAMLAVTLNSLTTISRFGCLLIAHHRGIRSLGLLLTIGSATSLAASLIVLPALAVRGHAPRGRVRGVSCDPQATDRVGSPCRPAKR